MFVKKFLTSLAPAALLASPALAQEAPRPDLDPAVWVVKDADTTIYLFGTIHALDGKSDWFNDEVKTSFDKSDELVVEAISPDDPTALLPLIQKYSMDMSGRSLPSKLSSEGQKMYAERLAKLGVPAAAFDKFRPFYAAMILTMIDMQSRGVTGEEGTEKILSVAAKKGGKKIGEIESMEWQLQMLNSLPEADQVRMLETTLKDLEKGSEVFEQLHAAWGAGNPDKVGEIMNKNTKDEPAMYDKLLVQRNKTWAEWIDTRLDKPGTVFIAVGAGHLAGPDSVQRFLKDRNIDAERVPATN